MGHPPNYMNDGTSNGTTYTYDAEGRLSAVSGSGTSAAYYYDPEGQRVESVVNGVLTQYGRDPQGRVVWRDLNQPYAQDIYLNGRHFGSLTTNGDANHTLNSVTYSMVDEVGTDREQFDGSQNALAKITSNPFGDNQITSGNTADSVFYTGKERDTESGNDYFGARYYGSSMGRWMSPDYSDSGDVPDPVPYADYANPQSLNLYAYVNNNPLTKIDPDGHFHCDPDEPYTDAKGNFGVKAGACHLDFSDYVDFFRHMTRADAKEIGVGILSYLQPNMSNCPNCRLGIMPFGMTGGLSGGSILTILEEDGNAIHAVINTSKGPIEVMANTAKEGDKLVLSGVHVGEGEKLSIGEIKAAARELGRQEGVSEVEVQGGVRTGGANPGHTPAPFTVKVN